MPEPWPTFESCPRCDALLWTDAETDGAWCSECDYSLTQTQLDL